jgi:hypothetical protein
MYYSDFTYRMCYNVNVKFKVCKSVHNRTFQINHQTDATIFHFIILTFVYSSTCFERFPAHHQELNDCSGSHWFYLRIVVKAVLWSWSGRPARPRTHTYRVYIYIYIHTYTHTYTYILRGFKTSNDAFRLSYSNAFDCSIRPFLDLFHSTLYIFHLSRFSGDGLVVSFLQVSSES